MRIEAYVMALHDDLARLAALGDESVTRAADALVVGLESALVRRLQEVLGEAALEVTAQLDDASVEVRLAGGDTELVVVKQDKAGGEAADEALSARVTLRLPERLKSRIEEAAGREGVSLNTWVIQSLQRAAETRRPHGFGRRRLTGYGQS